MDPAWSALVFILIAAALGWFWHDSLAAKEGANAAAQEACERLGLQLLDGTVAFVRIGLTRSSGGHVTLRRTYVFDYTADSIERRQGFLVLAGRQVESVGYAPGEQGRQPTERHASLSDTSRADEVPTTARPGAKILNIEDWRRQRHHRPPTPRSDDVDDAQR
jgi:hypothetical protein